MNVEIDPWGCVNIDDYSKLFDEFGILPFESIINEIDKPHRYMRRNIIFGHRNYENITQAIQKRSPFSVMSGFMPSGKVHLGHKMVMDQIIWHQKMGGNAFIGIADREAYSVRGISWETCRQTGMEEYILSLIALGLKPGAHIYFQSDSQQVKDLAFELGTKANFSELSAIYGFTGETNVAHMISALSQSADILQPQLHENGGPNPTVVPVGADQDPHIRLTRGLANKMNMFRVESRKDNKGNPYISIRGKATSEDVLALVAQALPWNTKLYEGHVDVFGTDDMESLLAIVLDIESQHNGYGFLPPISTYHRFMSGLQGGKMSSSVPESLISLTEDPEEAGKKVKRAKTGGKITLEEQKRSGGNPGDCSVYELLMFHLIEDDKHLEEIYSECICGKRMCGNCKKLAAELITEFLQDHQQLRENARDELDDYL